MSFLFDHPLYKPTPELLLGWSDDQIEPVVEALRQAATFKNEEIRRSAASISRSLFCAHFVSGNGVHYPRGRGAYSVPTRYRSEGKYRTYYYVINAMAGLDEAGLARLYTGRYGGAGGQGRESVAVATRKLLDLLDGLVDPGEQRAGLGSVETIVLRDSKGLPLDYEDSSATEEMRADVREVNRLLRSQDIRLEGARRRVLPGRRIFNKFFDRGGRFYFFGESVQNLSLRERMNLRWHEGDKVHPVAELDFSALHITMALTKAGVRVPDGDPYEIEGFDRDDVKLAVNVLFNAANFGSASRAIAKDLGGRAVGTDLARNLVEAVREAHPDLEPFFGSDSGARFQRDDSDIAMEVMLQTYSRTGRCPFPIHDSFLAPVGDLEVLEDVMLSVGERWGLPLRVKRASVS
ncbi:hypothetical protein NCCP2495_28030 [Dietzia sp. NCCP-2495]|uniref:hypothetical protein n=1 Tax=Dietzia sp. NCCP-2495 TaxID=2934675 RepID=UPI00223163C4|nr:hypothetical protein [Dietzia sp. NCCP-2495]GLB64923.1 hypothetical protein NCCP2495_28030 [Dietzia sp. NCCP-2495]